MSSKAFEVRSPAGRIILIIAGMLCLIVGFFAVKWCIGNALAARFEEKETVELSTRLAPGDPVTHYSLALLNEKTFLPEDFEKALEEYEKAAALSPNDYRFWFQLGKARERSGDSAGAEKALRKSLELAPNYSEVQWTLGNLLLRQGNSSEGFNLIRLAADGNERFLDPAVSIAWQIFDGDAGQLKQNIGDSSKVNAAFASFLLKQERYDEAFDAWNSLPVEERKNVFRQRGEEIYNHLMTAGKYRNALKIWADTAEGNKTYEIGKITDGGFEINEKQEKKSAFDWHIAEGAQPLIGVDTETVHGGALSQRIIFNSPNGADFRQVLQLVAVEAGKKYEFSIFYRSDLKTDATLKWEIVTPSDGRVLTATEPIAAKVDWTNLKAQFTAPETSEAVIIRLARAPCSSAICPISGSVWFDDFVLSAK